MTRPDERRPDERDEHLDLLRQAWNAHEAPQPADADEPAGDELDAAVRGWLAGAWAARDRAAVPASRDDADGDDDDDTLVSWSRRAWSGRRGPRATTDMDATTAGSVAWVRSAWRHAAPAAPPMPVPPRLASRQPARLLRLADGRRRVAAVAAAALVLVSLGLALQLGPSGARPDLPHPGTGEPGPVVDAGPDASTPGLDDLSTPTAPRDDAGADTLPEGRLVAVGPDRLEGRSGRVRLVLLTPPDARP